MNKFWNFMNRTAVNDAGESQQVGVLRIDGPITSDAWWGDEVTPEAFREELEAHPGDIDVYINSPGGDIAAASQIYTMLVEHKGNVTVKIEGLAASAASVIAMAGTTVLMSPVAYMMIHGASTLAIGNKKAMQHEVEVLEEIDKGVRDAYCLKTGLRESKVAQMMEDETWMSAKTCISLGFADGYIGKDNPEPEQDDDPDDDDEFVDKTPMPVVAWSGRQQFAALLKIAGITNPADLFERMNVTKSPVNSVESTPETEPEKPEEPVAETEPEAKKEPEPEITCIESKQYYDRLKSIKDKF